MSQIVRCSSTPKLEGNTLSGIAHVYGTRATIQGTLEQFAVGAFDEALKADNIMSFYQHKPEQPLASTSSGTLQLRATTEGLEYEMDLPPVSYAEDLKVLIERGVISGMSIGFIPNKYAWKREGADRVRMHTQIRSLVEISPVSLPAFEGTSVNLRAREDTDIRTQLILIRDRIRHY